MHVWIRGALIAPAFALIASVAGCGQGLSTQGASSILVSIKASPEVGDPPLVVDFEALVDESWSGDPRDLTYTWDFGDGSAAGEGDEVTHTFESVGSFTVTLTVTDGRREGTANKQIDVGVAGPGTDLTISGVEATPTTINPGSPITVKFTMTNQGTEPTEGNVIVRLYVLPETEWPANPGSATGVVTFTQPMQGEQTVELSGTAYVPALFSAGQYYAWVLADGPDDISETNENNNAGRSAVPIDVTTGNLPVDLLVESVTAASPNATAGGTLQVTTSIRNAGTAASPSFKLAHRLSIDPTIDPSTDIALGPLVAVPSVAAGATVQLQHDVPFTSALDNRPYYLGVFADVNGDVAETNEQNNSGAITGNVTVSGGTGCTEDSYEPNEVEANAIALAAGSHGALKLCPSSKDWYEISIAAGQRLTAAASFSNGDGDLNLALYKVGQTPTVSQSNGTGNTEAVDSGLSTESATYRLRVDSGANATGIPYTLDLTIASSGGNGKDLVPANLVVSPTSVSTGGTVTVAFSVFNFGNEDVTTGTTAEIRLSADATLDAGDLLLDSTAVAAVAAGANVPVSRTVTIPVGTPSANYQLIVKVDSADAVTETYEDNNTAMKQLGVGVGCGEDAWEDNDSQAQAIPLGSGVYPGLRSCTGDEDWFAIELLAGTTVTVKALFSDAEGDVDAYLRRSSGTTVKWGTTGTDNEILTWTVDADGTYYVRVRMYSDSGAVDGNGYTLDIDGAISDTVDLSPGGVTFTPSSASPGDEVQVDFTVKNLSRQVAPASTASIRLSLDQTIDGGDAEMTTVATASIGTAGSASYTKKFFVPDSAAGSSWYVGVFVDPANGVTEASENNNGRASSSKLTVAVPCTDDAKEDNDNEAQSRTITLGATVTDLMVCSGDLDWFRVTAGSTGPLTVRIEFVATAGDLDLAVYNAAGTTMLGNSSSAANDYEEVVIDATASTAYKIRVKGFNGASGAYTLRTSQ